MEKVFYANPWIHEPSGKREKEEKKNCKLTQTQIW